MINSFTATPSYIHRGDSSVLSWSVSNADSVSITPTVGPAASSGSYTVVPDSTTTYTLTATNTGGSVSASTTITVVLDISTYSTGSSPGTTIAGPGIATSGVGGSDSGTAGLSPLHLLLLGLLGVAAVVIVLLLTRRPAAVSVGQNARAITGHTSVAAVTLPAIALPRTTPAALGSGARLVSSSGNEIFLAGGIGSLGRSDFKSMVTAEKADLISRNHLLVEYEDGHYYIEDRSSTNGTRLNGADIRGRGRQKLREGDVLELGDTLSLTFKN